MKQVTELCRLTPEELTTIMGGNGSHIDPNGNPTTGDTGDNGCGIDPNG